MTDGFDDAFDAARHSPASMARTYTPVPAGVCEVEIVRADRKAVPWRVTDQNPTGECLALRLRASSGHAFVFCDVPDDKPWLAGHVARAVGVYADELLPEHLVGQRAKVEIGHVTTRNGETRAVVRKWLPRPAPRQSTGDTPTLTDAVTEWATGDRPQRPKRVTGRRPKVQPEPSDDIPF
jgi:hypothetical protein